VEGATVCNKPCGLDGCVNNGVEFSFPDEAARGYAPT
jgi:hypothetical protein